MTELEKWEEAQPYIDGALIPFLEWLDEQKIELATMGNGGYRMYPHVEDRAVMLARYFGIDLKKLENERRALLELCASPTQKSAAQIAEENEHGL